MTNGWVEKYISKLLNCDLKREYSSLRNEKMEHANRLYYKYCYVCEESNRDDTTIDYNIENLKNDQLF